jgi:hypothetical protein
MKQYVLFILVFLFLGNACTKTNDIKSTNVFSFRQKEKVSENKKNLKCFNSKTIETTILFGENKDKSSIIEKLNFKDGFKECKYDPTSSYDQEINVYLSSNKVVSKISNIAFFYYDDEALQNLDGSNFVNLERLNAIGDEVKYVPLIAGKMYLFYDVTKFHSCIGTPPPTTTTTTTNSKKITCLQKHLHSFWAWPTKEKEDISYDFLTDKYLKYEMRLQDLKTQLEAKDTNTIMTDIFTHLANMSFQMAKDVSFKIAKKYIEKTCNQLKWNKVFNSVNIREVANKRIFEKTCSYLLKNDLRESIENRQKLKQKIISDAVLAIKSLIQVKLNLPKTATIMVDRSIDLLEKLINGESADYNEVFYVLEPIEKIINTGDSPLLIIARLAWLSSIHAIKNNNSELKSYLNFMKRKYTTDEKTSHHSSFTEFKRTSLRRLRFSGVEDIGDKDFCLYSIATGKEADFNSSGLHNNGALKDPAIKYHIDKSSYKNLYNNTCLGKRVSDIYREKFKKKIVEKILSAITEKIREKSISNFKKEMEKHSKIIFGKIKYNDKIKNKERNLVEILNKFRCENNEKEKCKLFDYYKKQLLVIKSSKPKTLNFKNKICIKLKDQQDIEICKKTNNYNEYLNGFIKTLKSDYIMNYYLLEISKLPSESLFEKSFDKYNALQRKLNVFKLISKLLLSTNFGALKKLKNVNDVLRIYTKMKNLSYEFHKNLIDIDAVKKYQEELHNKLFPEFNVSITKDVSKIQSQIIEVSNNFLTEFNEKLSEYGIHFSFNCVPQDSKNIKDLNIAMVKRCAGEFLKNLEINLKYKDTTIKSPIVNSHKNQSSNHKSSSNLLFYKGTIETPVKQFKLLLGFIARTLHEKNKIENKYVITHEVTEKIKGNETFEEVLTTIINIRFPWFKDITNGVKKFKQASTQKETLKSGIGIAFQFIDIMTKKKKHSSYYLKKSRKIINAIIDERISDVFNIVIEIIGEKGNSKVTKKIKDGLGVFNIIMRFVEKDKNGDKNSEVELKKELMTNLMNNIAKRKKLRGQNVFSLGISTMLGFSYNLNGNDLGDDYEIQAGGADYFGQMISMPIGLSYQRYTTKNRPNFHLMIYPIDIAKYGTFTTVKEKETGEENIEKADMDLGTALSLGIQTGFFTDFEGFPIILGVDLRFSPYQKFGNIGETRREFRVMAFVGIYFPFFDIIN